MSESLGNWLLRLGPRAAPGARQPLSNCCWMNEYSQASGDLRTILRAPHRDSLGDPSSCCGHRIESKPLVPRFCALLTGLIAEQFLETAAAQLTYHGLCELTAAAKEGELSVFFRNNHFSTMTKHKVMRLWRWRGGRGGRRAGVAIPSSWFFLPGQCVRQDRVH